MEMVSRKERFEVQPHLSQVNGSCKGKKDPELIKSVHTTHKNMGLIEIFVIYNVCILHRGIWGFLGGSVVKNLPANA